MNLLVVSNNPGLINIVNQALTPYLGDLQARATGSAAEVVRVIDQALPAVLVPKDSLLYPTPIAPQAPVGAPLIISKTVLYPNPPMTSPSAAASTKPTNPSIINVTPIGNYQTQTDLALHNYTIASIVDVATGLAPTNDSATLQIILTGGPSLDTYGLDLTGRSLQFVTGGPYTDASGKGTQSVRIVTYASGLVMVVANKDINGNPFDWAGGHGPAAGNVVQFNTARTNSENVFGPGQPLNMVVATQKTTPVGAPPLIGPATVVVNVRDQELTNGSPLIVHIV
jgi:hypothetical protein